jgi:hypothetical protein
MAVFFVYGLVASVAFMACCWIVFGIADGITARVQNKAAQRRRAAAIKARERVEEFYLNNR